MQILNPLNTLDLNLLRALKALLEEKHVTRAAERIELSQPSMSRALQRLRKAFNDPLLVQGSQGFDLTARAQALYEPLQNIFLQLADLAQPVQFEPKSTQAEITIATRDYEMITILPAVINAINREAPNLTFRITSISGDDFSALNNHEADFILSATESTSANLYQKTLYVENFVCLLSKKNAKQKLTLQRFLQMQHCLITISGVGLGVVDEVLAEQALRREIAVRVPHFFAAAYIVANSNFIVTLPRRLGVLAAEHTNISIVQPPILIPDFPVYLYWHARKQNSPLHQWVRNAIIKESSFLQA